MILGDGGVTPDEYEILFGERPLPGEPGVSWPAPESSPAGLGTARTTLRVDVSHTPIRANRHRQAGHERSDIKPFRVGRGVPEPLATAHAIEPSPPLATRKWYRKKRVLVPTALLALVLLANQTADRSDSSLAVSPAEPLTELDQLDEIIPPPSLLASSSPPEDAVAAAVAQLGAAEVVDEFTGATEDIEFAASHVAVGSAVNQSRADRGPQDWRPPLESAWCGYAVDWIAIKTRWDLALTHDEAEALAEMLDTCE